MSSGGNSKNTKTHQIKTPKKTQVSSPWKNWRNAGSCEENIKIYLAANDELSSKRINELNGALSDLQVSIEHSDEVNMENFKAIDRDVSYISGTFRNHAKNTDDRLYETEERLPLEDSSWRNNLGIDGVEEDGNETWD